MLRVRFLCLLLALTCALGVAGTAFAAEVDCDATYCFTAQDFSSTQEPLAGICITALPDGAAGTVMLGNRILRPGDILTAEQINQMTFHPLRTPQDQVAQVSYLPIYENRVDQAEVMTLSIRGKEDKAPIAQDSSLETYKNLPNEGKLAVSDPEGEALTYSLIRSPRRGTVDLKEDGSFVYTPKKNKVGVESFTFTAADPAGNVSREATVTVQILKPTDARQYTDTVGLDCRFEAEWLRNTGLFVGETVSGQACFFPDKEVSRGQFLAMLVQALDIPVTQVSMENLPENIPEWLKPYLAAAMRSGLLSGVPEQESFDAHDAITGAEAAVMLQNALDLSVSDQILQTAMTQESDVPAWAAASVTVMQKNGIALSGNVLTRAQAAQVLYQVSHLAVTAPGAAVIRMQQ